MTEGFSGSDLKNFCIAAAYQPVRDLLHQEKSSLKRKSIDNNETTNTPSKKLKLNSGKEIDKNEENLDNKITQNMEIESRNTEVHLRSINMEDFRKAISEVSASVSENAFAITELRRWNEMYGEGGSRRKPSLSYFG